MKSSLLLVMVTLATFHGCAKTVEESKVAPTPGGGSTSTGTLSLNLSAATGTTAESGNYTVTINLTAASSQAITVNLATSNGTATAGTDYTATNTTVTFTAGQTSKTVNVPITSENLDESDETFTVTISNPTNANLGSTTSQTVTITDNDTKPAFNYPENVYFQHDGDCWVAYGTNSGYVTTGTYTPGNTKWVDVNIPTTEGTTGGTTISPSTTVFQSRYDDDNDITIVYDSFGCSIGAYPSSIANTVTVTDGTNSQSFVVTFHWN